MENGLDWVDELDDLRWEAGVAGIAHSGSYGLDQLTLVEDLFDAGVETGSYLIEYRVGGRLAGLRRDLPLQYALERWMIPLDAAIVDVLPGVTWAWYRRYGLRLFMVVHQRHVDHVVSQVEAIMALAGVEWRRKVRRLGRRRVVVLGLSVDPATGAITLPKRLRRRLRALEHAERTRGPLTDYQREVLEYLRAVQREVEWRAIERAWEAWVPQRSET